MLASPGHSPRHILPPPSPSAASETASDINGLDLVLPLGSDSGKGLMGPPPPRKRKQAEVVDEDEYVAGIEKIIERDFFPDIPKLQDRLAWLEANRSGDPALIREAQLAILQRRREREKERLGVGGRERTPIPGSAIFASPASFISGMQSPALSARASPAPSHVFSEIALPSEQDPSTLDTSVPLDEFLRRYTSEDNASFSKIVDKVNKQRRVKYNYLQDNRDTTAAIEGSGDRVTDGFGTSGQSLSTLTTWSYRAKNLLMYDSAERPDAPLTEKEQQEKLNGPPKAINLKSTRFHGKMFDSKVKDDDTVAILYTPIPGSTPVAWPFDAERAKKRYDLEELRKTPGERDNGESKSAGKSSNAGYSYVATPSPAPGVEESPFLTWGEIEGTPLRLEMEDTPVGIGGNGEGPHFRIPVPPTRDARAQSLSRDAARHLKEKFRLSHNMTSSPSPLRGSSSPAIGTLSAAAQKFVSKAMAKTSATVDAGLRASYRASTTPGTPRMYRNAVRVREGSLPRRDESLPLRSPSASPLVTG
eukprot:TRINITY_DN9603_c0_g1_i1.p1 TRINITY_DN9603_c0_g1~~TRINITY_DN9603_c0_g1_i1.p1  ORF type:complete len:533 (-),score=98.00 TRINITY_DN9603_c0_g1_i1:99-1697(-)